MAVGERAQTTIVVEGPELVIALIERALGESQKVTVVPDSIFPGYILDVVHDGLVDEPTKRRCLAITTTGAQCKRPAHEDHAQCVFHLYLLQKRRQETEANEDHDPEPSAVRDGEPGERGAAGG